MQHNRPPRLAHKHSLCKPSGWEYRSTKRSQTPKRSTRKHSTLLVGASPCRSYLIWRRIQRQWNRWPHDAPAMWTIGWWCDTVGWVWKINCTNISLFSFELKNIWYFIPWNTMVDKRSDIVSEKRNPMENVVIAPNSATPAASFLFSNHTNSGIARYNCISIEMLTKYGAHCSSNGIQFEIFKKVGQEFCLHKSALWPIRVPHWGPLPMCSRIHALNNTTATSGGVIRINRPMSRRGKEIRLNFFKSLDNDWAAWKPLINKSRSA